MYRAAQNITTTHLLNDAEEYFVSASTRVCAGGEEIQRRQRDASNCGSVLLDRHGPCAVGVVEAESALWFATSTTDPSVESVVNKESEIEGKGGEEAPMTISNGKD